MDRRWRVIVPAVIMVATLRYGSVLLKDDALSLSGLYGMYLPYAALCLVASWVAVRVPTTVLRVLLQYFLPFIIYGSVIIPILASDKGFVDASLTGAFVFFAGGIAVAQIAPWIPLLLVAFDLYAKHRQTFLGPERLRHKTDC